MKRLFLHAPNVHVGGGAVLLRALLDAPNLGPVIANLDARAVPAFALPRDGSAFLVAATLAARVRAEWRLARLSRDDDTILCFHGLPPMLPVRGRVLVFKQNRLHLGTDSLALFAWRTRLRLGLERLLCKLGRGRVDEYIVQTPSMKLALDAWHGANPRVRVAPFLAAPPPGAPPRHAAQGEFLYVADGEAHKNHRTLLAAWILLAAEGLFPPLALTLPARAAPLWRDMAEAVASHGLQLVNLGTLSHQDILARYRVARALIFPSTTESFGLPLIEASAAGLPILAGELDYVRDVCTPAQTFDPQSPRSIAAAVKRFLNVAPAPLHLRTAQEFVAEIAAPEAAGASAPCTACGPRPDSHNN